MFLKSTELVLIICKGVLQQTGVQMLVYFTFPLDFSSLTIWVSSCGLLYLVIVAVRDGIGVNSSLLHLEQDSDSQDRLAILPTQLHQHPVTHLYTHVQLGLKTDLSFSTNGSNHCVCLNKEALGKSLEPHQGAAVSSPAFS